MIKLTPHEQRILDLVKEHPDLINNPKKRKEIAVQNGLTEKTLRNRIGDLRKYGVLPSSQESEFSFINTDFDDIDLFRIGQILWASKNDIIRNVVIVSILSIILAFMLPKTYRTSAVIMPPSSGFDSSMLLNNPEMLSLQSMMFSNSSNSNTFIAIMKSRKIMRSLINHFNLVEFYDVANEEKAQEALEENTNFEINEEGLISITTDIKTDWFHFDKNEDFCKKLSMDITNYFVMKLDEVNKILKSEKAAQHRGFIENRYYQTIDQLATTEERLKVFQEEHNTIALTEQTTAAIQAVSEIISNISISKARIAISKVKLDILKETLPKNHPEIILVETEIILLNTELIELNTQLENLDNGNNNFTMIPGFSDVPDLGLKLGRLIRDVEVQNKLYAFLTQQYEEAKIKEAKDTPTVQVLDYAILPQLKYKPSRARVCIIGFVLSTILSMYYVYFRTRWQLSIKTIY